MSEFLVIIPEGWTQLDYVAAEQAEVGINGGYILNSIAGNNYLDLCEKLVSIGMLPEGSYIIEAKLINDEVFIVRLG